MRPCYLHQVYASLQTSGALKVSTQLQVLVAAGREEMLDWVLDSAVGALREVGRHTVETVCAPGLWVGAGYWYWGELAMASGSTLSSGPGTSGK